MDDGCEYGATDDSVSRLVKGLLCDVSTNVIQAGGLGDASRVDCACSLINFSESRDA